MSNILRVRQPTDACSSCHPFSWPWKPRSPWRLRKAHGCTPFHELPKAVPLWELRLRPNCNKAPEGMSAHYDLRMISFGVVYRLSLFVLESPKGEQHQTPYIDIYIYMFILVYSCIVCTCLWYVYDHVYAWLSVRVVALIFHSRRLLDGVGRVGC